MIFARTLSKARMAPIAGFLALTAVSAALAQTNDGIDLTAIKERATEATADAQTLVDAVAGKGEAHRGEAQDLREKGLAAVAATQSAAQAAVAIGVENSATSGLMIEVSAESCHSGSISVT